MFVGTSSSPVAVVLRDGSGWWWLGKSAENAESGGYDGECDHSSDDFGDRGIDISPP